MQKSTVKFEAQLGCLCLVVGGGELIGKLRKLVEARGFESFIIGVILVNSVTLGLEAVTGLSQTSLRILAVLDSLFLFIFTFEIFIKIIVYRWLFFVSPGVCLTSWSLESPCCRLPDLLQSCGHSVSCEL